MWQLRRRCDRAVSLAWHCSAHADMRKLRLESKVAGASHSHGAASVTPPRIKTPNQGHHRTTAPYPCRQGRFVASEKRVGDFVLGREGFMPALPLALAGEG